MPWTALFDNYNPMALDLLSRMLMFNPIKRYSIEQCINHPYFVDLHDPGQEPLSKAPFDWSFDNFVPTKSTIQNMIYNEALEFKIKEKSAQGNQTSTGDGSEIISQDEVGIANEQEPEKKT